MHNLTQEQIEEPKQSIYDYVGGNAASEIQLSIEEKKALISKILEKVFGATS